MDLFKVGSKIEQNAEATENSHVIQAARDVYIGLTLPQVLETVDYQIKSQFEGLLSIHAPILIQQEMIKVEAVLDEFKDRMSVRITEQFESLLFSTNEDEAAKRLTAGLTNSNFQYLFKESIEQVIRKKDQAPQESLVELLIDIANTTSNTDYLVEEAINVLKHVNKNQVNFVLFIGGIIHNTSYRKSTSDINQDFDGIELVFLSEIKWMCSYLLEQNISKVDLEYLIYKGLILESKSYTTDPMIYDRICNACFPKALKENLNQTNEQLVKLFLPEIEIVIDKFGLENPYKIDVLSKISNVIFEKNLYHFMKNIQNYVGINKNKVDDWVSLLNLHLF